MPNIKNTNDLKNLLARLQYEVDKTVEKNVAPIIVETMREHVETDVYNTYTPTQYERRMNDGGLIDHRNHKVDMNYTTHTVTVSNETKGIDGEILVDKIVYGDDYDWEYSEIYKMQPYPRDFIGGAKDDLLRSKTHIEALKFGLKNKKIDTI